jgi:hypothetical protein
MPKVRKKPCRICRRWFQPDARVGDRQRACGKPECQATRRQKTQSGWRKRNPDYGIAWRLDQRAAQTPPPEALRLPAPLAQLPWNVAKDQFSPQGADFLGVMSALILRAAKDQIRPYLPDPSGLASRLPIFPKKTSSSLPHTESPAGDHNGRRRPRTKRKTRMAARAPRRSQEQDTIPKPSA